MDNILEAIIWLAEIAKRETPRPISSVYALGALQDVLQNAGTLSPMEAWKVKRAFLKLAAAYALIAEQEEKAE